MNRYILNTGDPGKQLVIREVNISWADARRGSPYNMSFELDIVSGAFSGTGAFTCDIADFLRFINELEDTYRFRKTMTECRDLDVGSFMLWHMDPLGHLTISGELITTDQELKFFFETDQTALPEFLHDLHRDFSLPPQ